MGDRAVDGGAAARPIQEDTPGRGGARKPAAAETELLLARIQALEEELYLERCEKNQWLLSLEKQIEQNKETERVLGAEIAQRDALIKQLEVSNATPRRNSRHGNQDLISAGELETLEREIEGLTTLLIESKKLYELKQTSAYTQIKELEEQLKQVTSGANALLGGSSPRKRKLADFSRTLDLFMTVKSQTLDELEKVQFELLNRQESLAEAAPAKLLARLQAYYKKLEGGPEPDRSSQSHPEYVKSLVQRLSKVTRSDMSDRNIMVAPREAPEDPLSFRDTQDEPQLLISTAEQVLEALEGMKVPPHLKDVVDQIEHIDELIDQMSPSDKDQASLITDEVHLLIQKFAPSGYETISEGSYHQRKRDSANAVERRTEHSATRSTHIPKNSKNMEDEKARLLSALEKKKMMKKSSNPTDAPRSLLEEGGSPQPSNLTLKSPTRSPLGQRDQNLTPVGGRVQRDLHLDSTPYAETSNKRLATTQGTRSDTPLVDPTPYMRIIEQYEKQASKDRKWIDDLKKEIEERVGSVLMTQQENEALKKHNNALRKKIVDLEEDIKSHSSRWSEPPQSNTVREFKAQPRSSNNGIQVKPQNSGTNQAFGPPEGRKAGQELTGASGIARQDQGHNLRAGADEEEDKKNKKLILKLERGIAKVLETSSKLLETALETHPASHEIPRKSDLVDRMLSTLMALIFERRTEHRTEGQLTQNSEDQKRLPSREQIDRRDVRQHSLSPHPEKPTTAKKAAPVAGGGVAANTADALKAPTVDWKETGTQELFGKLSTFTQAICTKSERMGELQRANSMMDRRVKALLDRVADDKTDDPNRDRRAAGARSTGQAARLSALEEFECV